MVHATPAARRWAAIIDEQEASGQIIRAFAEARDINVMTLYPHSCGIYRGLSRRVTMAAGGSHGACNARSQAVGRYHR